MSPYSIELPRCPSSKGRWLMIAPVISTAHASRTDYALLESSARDLSVCIAEICPEIGGHLLNIDSISAEEIAADLPGFSAEFHRLIITLQSFGYAYVRFDPDGDVVPGLPIYTWN